MKQHQGVWLPDHEQHMIDWMNKSGEIVDGKGTYQIKKYRAALQFVHQFRTAVDIGAHVGFWSMQMCKRFEFVRAFEPVAEHRECWELNVKPPQGHYVDMRPVALGDHEEMISIMIPQGSSGGSHVSGVGDIQMVTLDSFELQNVDFIKIDCEGYELDVLNGAVETLKRCRPCVIVEQKEHIMQANYGTKGKPAVDFLIDMGARLRREISGDYILNWS